MQNDVMSFEGVIACDDIRQEMSGKHVIVGAYGGVVLIETYPQQVNLAFFIQVAAGLLGDVRFEFKITSEHGANFGQVTGGIVAIDAGLPNTIALPSFPVPLFQTGKINLEYRPINGEWRVIKSLYVFTRLEFELRKTQSATN